jgi:hypothetical protein
VKKKKLKKKSENSHFPEPLSPFPPHLFFAGIRHQTVMEPTTTTQNLSRKTSALQNVLGNFFTMPVYL